jgi:hypothetical protein
MADRICGHPLRIATHLPAWLACDICHADFLHRQDCPGLGTPGCADKCMNGADLRTAALDALLSLPAKEPQR